MKLFTITFFFLIVNYSSATNLIGDIADELDKTIESIPGDITVLEPISDVTDVVIDSVATSAGIVDDAAIDVISELGDTVGLADVLSVSFSSLASTNAAVASVIHGLVPTATDLVSSVRGIEIEIGNGDGEGIDDASLSLLSGILDSWAIIVSELIQQTSFFN